MAFAIKLEAYVTVIAAIVNGESTYIASESRVTQGELAQPTTMHKVFTKTIRAGDFEIPVGFGVAGSPHYLTDITYNWEMPPFPDLHKMYHLTPYDVDNYVFGTLLIALQQKYEEDEREIGLLVAIDRYIYTADNTLAGARTTMEFDAIGEGKPVVLGALATMRRLRGKLDREDLVQAVEITSEFVPSCDDNVVVIEVERPNWLRSMKG